MNFVVVEKGDLFANDMGKLDEGRIKGFDFAFGEILKKTAQGDEVISLGNSLQAFAVGVSLAVELEAKFADEFGSDINWFKITEIFVGLSINAKLRLLIENIEANITKAEEIALVIFCGLEGAAALDFEMLDVIGDKFGDIHKYIITQGLFLGDCIRERGICGII